MVVPAGVPEPLAIAAVTGSFAPVARTLFPSRSWMTGLVVQAAPDTTPDGWVERASCAAAAARTNGAELTAVRPTEPKRRMCVPVPVIAKSLNVAMPSTGCTDFVPASVPLPLNTVTVTGAVEAGAMLPAASRTCTTGCRAKTIPELAPEGCVDTASCVGAPACAATVKLFVVADARPVEANMSVCGPVPLTPRSANVATPFTAVAVVVPVNVPEPLPMAAVITADEPVERLFEPSRTSTTGCVAKRAFATAPAGCVVTASSVAGAFGVASDREIDIVGFTAAAVNRSVCAPLPVIVRFVKVATPFTASTVVAPDSDPVPDAMDAVTGSVELLITKPAESTTRTMGWVANGTPDTDPAGCRCRTRATGAGVATRKVDDRAVSSPGELNARL